MTHGFILPLADSKATLAIVGGKGASLARLANAGLPVPDGFHVTTAAYQQFVAQNDLQARILAALASADALQPTTLETASRAIYDLFARASMPHDIAGAITGAYLKLAGTHPIVAVRSSATAEDLPDLSFAGQQETFLNIQGTVAVQDAVKRCWASLWTPRAIGYRIQHHIAHDAVALAVVVQILIHADAAGIMFTANPVNGRRDQIVINAAWGLGEAIVGGLVTPDTLVVDKASGRMIERDIAEKQVMTVRVDGGTEERPVPENLRRATVLSDEQAIDLARFGTQIEKLYAMPMDIEWTLTSPPSPLLKGAGGFAIVQARPITALPELPAPSMMEWMQRMPDPKGQYMRVSIVDLMPDPVSPLFATLGLGALNTKIHQMLSEILQTKSELPLESFLTINEYAYQSARFTARQGWWMITRMIPKMLHILHTGVARWRDVALPRYTETTQRWQARLLADLTAPELWTGVCDVVDAAMYNLAWQMAWMGSCAGSEGLFTRVYEKLVKRDGDPAATTFVMGYATAPIRAEKSLYDLATWVRARTELAAHVANTPSDQLATEIARDEIPANVNVDAWRELQGHLRAYLQQFGNAIYDLDFAKPLPLDDPAPMLATIKMYLRGEGHNPHERQQSAEAKRKQATENVLRRVRGLKRWAFTKSLNWAQSLAQVREDGIAAIGIGYPILRNMLLELGARLVHAGALKQPGDIFWMRQNEVEEIVAQLERGASTDSMVSRVEQRQASARAAKRVTPPPMLPPKKKYMGFSMEGVVAVDEGSHTANAIKGVGASAGQVTAPARVLSGPEDFDQMRPGEVLVAGITTPAWTPLFAMASAVVTDIGGPLSHGSIVAREYGIPAVLGTGIATKRIRSGQIITVDGGAGTVTLLKN